MKKMTYLLAFLALTTLTAHAQHFDWVKRYYGPRINGTDEIHRVISSVADRDGNLYIIGHFAPGANIDTTELLPVPGANKYSTLIAKLSPSGELLWHKAIHCVGRNSYAHDIRKSGDTAIVVMVSFELPHDGTGANYNPVYYLDTFLSTTDNLLMVTDSIANYNTNAFITLDYDGNVKEQHFLQLAYVDSTGATLRLSNTNGSVDNNRIDTRILSNEMFNIDNEGNIYVCRSAIDVKSFSNPTQGGSVVLSVENGGIGQLRILIDGQRSLYYTPTSRSDHRNQQIIKFSPHFEQIIDAVYVFDSMNIPDDLYTYITARSFEKDDEDNLYLLLGGDHYPDTMLVSNSDSLLCISNDMVGFDACMIEYNTALHANRIVQLSCTPDPLNITKSYHFHSTAYDKEDGSLFLLGSVQRTGLTVNDNRCWITYHDDTLDLNRNLFWLRIDTSNNLVSYGKARTPSQTRIKLADACFMQSSLIAKGNRVFSQVGYQHNICFRDSVINVEPTDHGIGLMCWDYDGHEIEYIDYNAYNIRNKTGRIHIVDSILYLTGIINSSADFGEYHINAVGHDQAYIACYKDSSFMTPYVYTDPRVGQAIEWEQDLSFFLSDTPVVLTATATSGLPVSYVCSDTAVARVGGSTLHLLSDGVATITACQNGNEYGYYSATPVTKTLTVSIDTTINDTTIVDTTIIDTTGISPVYGSHISAYPNPTTGRVTIDMDHLLSPRTPARDSSDIQVTLTDKSGAFVKYGNPFRQRVNVNCSGADPIVSATLTDMAGRREEVRLTPQGDGRYTLDLTSRPQATYLLTLTTASGQRHTVRLLKQSNIFSR